MKKLLCIWLCCISAVVAVAQTNLTMSDGTWSDEAIWSLNRIPDYGDTIFVRHNIQLDMDLTLNDNYMVITDTASICSQDYGIQIQDGSRLLNYGTITVAYVNLYGGTLINHNGGLIRTQYLYQDTKKGDAEFINNGTFFETPNLENECVRRAPQDTVVVLDTAQVVEEDTLVICKGESPELPYSRAVYLWENGAVNSEFRPDISGMYKVTITSKLSGGVGQDEVYVKVKPALTSVPNIFTPNGDDVNEVFLPYNFRLSTLWVYNRWGKKVLEVAKLSETTFDELSDGVYFYVIEHENECVEQNPLKGWVQISR